jgi:hypothetical protein
MNPNITSMEWHVLNATADDAENLEQIYRSLAFECSADPDHPGDPAAYCWREARPQVLLSEIADAIQSLVARGFLVPRRDPAEELSRNQVGLRSAKERAIAERRPTLPGSYSQPVPEESNPDDLSFVWRAWFEMSQEGRSLWSAMPEPASPLVLK